MDTFSFSLSVGCWLQLIMLSLVLGAFSLFLWSFPVCRVSDLHVGLPHTACPFSSLPFVDFSSNCWELQLPHFGVFLSNVNKVVLELLAITQHEVYTELYFGWRNFCCKTWLVGSPSWWDGEVEQHLPQMEAHWGVKLLAILILRLVSSS